MSQLRFKLLVRDDALGDQQLAKRQSLQYCLGSNVS
jgi:hypothetical protein